MLTPSAVMSSTPMLALTKAELATELLRRRIRSGDLPPGTPLRIDALRRELGMSSTPVREALRILQADRLVDYQPHRGATVAESVGDHSQMEEVYRLRMLLEPYAASVAAKRISDTEIDRLQRAHQALVKAARSTRSGRSRVSEHNSAWHFMLYEAAGMPLLSELIRRLWEAFPWRTFWAVGDAIAISIEEHESMLEAVRRHDSEKTANLMRVHIGQGLSHVENERRTAKNSQAVEH